MRLPFVARSAFDERGTYIEKLEADLARVRSENHDLVNAMTANNRVIQPFASAKEKKPTTRPTRPLSVFQREKSLTRRRMSAQDLGTAPGKPPYIS